MTAPTNIPKPTPDPGRRFRTILADPPWDIFQRGRRGAEGHYNLMTLEHIKGMGKALERLIADDAHLWLWVTNGTLRQGYDVAEAWGFTVRSPLTWVKWRLGLGVYLRNSTEHLLFATKGRAPVHFNAQPTWFTAPQQEHSHKSEEQFAIIERVSPGPYLELFARRRPPSNAAWSVWGNEIDSDISLPGYPVPSDDANARLRLQPSRANANNLSSPAQHDGESSERSRVG